VRYLVLAVACSLAVLTYVQRQGFVAGTPYIQTDLKLDDVQMGFLLAGWLVAYGLFQVPGGLLGDRIGARLLLTILVVAWSIVLAAVAVIAVFPAGWLAFALLFALRSLFGALQAGGFPGLARVVADWVPKPRRGFAQGLIWTFSRLGGFVAPLLVGLWLFKVFHGWAIAFVLLGLLGLVWCVLFWLWFRNQPAEMPQVNSAERALIETGRPADGATREPINWRRFLSSRNVWALSLMYGFVGFSGNFITSWLPSYLKRHRSLTDEETAWLTGLPLAFGIVSCVLGGVLSDWLIRRTGSRNWGRRIVGITTLVFAGFTILSSIWVHDVWLLALSFSMAFFFNDGIMGPAWASCADVGERHAGTLSGAMNMTGALIGAVGMVLTGVLFKRHLQDVMFVIFACSYFLAALCWLGVDVTRPLVQRAEQS
jgi:sugar phosphate permease